MFSPLWVMISNQIFNVNSFSFDSALYPSLRKMYDENNGNTQVFYFKNAVATFSSFSGAPEVVEF